MLRHLWPIKIDEVKKRELDEMDLRVRNVTAKRANDLALLRQSKKSAVSIDEVISVQAKLNADEKLKARM